MKKIQVLLIAILCCQTIFAQQKDVVTSKSKKTETKVDDKMPQIFANLSSGINNPNGIFGIGIDARVAPKVLVGLGIGSSSWGAKMNLKSMYFFNDNFLGGAIGLSLNYSSGVNYEKGSKYLFAITEKNGNRYNAYGTFGSTVSMNLMYGKYWKVSKRGRFFINTGLCGKFNKPNIDMYNANTNNKVVDDFELRTIKIQSPGGLVFAAGFLIRLNRN